MSGVTSREPARNGSEQDALSRYWRSQLCWTQRAGATSWVKRSIRRRERQAGKRETRHATSSD